MIKETRFNVEEHPTLDGRVIDVFPISHRYIHDLEQQAEKLQEENKQLKDLINTILTFSFFKEECPLNFDFEDNSKEDEAQNIFYSDEYCENNCNDIYKECWLKYFKELQGSREMIKWAKNEKRYIKY